MSLFLTLGLSFFMISLAVYLRFSFQNFYGDFWGVISVNLLASLVLAFVYKIKSVPSFLEINHFQFLTALCFCGALSTFSSYVQIFYRLIEEGSYLTATSFVLLNNLLCLAVFVVITKFL